MRTARTILEWELYAPIVRQAQLDVLDSAAVNTTEHLAMTVSIDTDKGTSKVIHPLGKDILAARMATQWLAMTDSRESSESTVPSGPLARRASAMEEDASTGTVTFAEGTAKGLRAMTPNYITKRRQRISSRVLPTHFKASRSPARTACFILLTLLYRQYGNRSFR